jgi:hypothetical protein
LSCGNPFKGTRRGWSSPENPLPIAGETWYEIRLPKFMRFRTGKKVENRLIFPVFVVLGVLLIPGVWGFTTATAERLFQPPTAQTANP